jgi:hypothetical protein
MNNEFTANLDQDEMIVLAGGWAGVPKSYLQELRRHALERIAVLPAGEIVTVEWLLEVRFWRELSANDRRVAGLCISRLVADKELPLERISITGKTSAYYELL